MSVVIDLCEDDAAHESSLHQSRLPSVVQEYSFVVTGAPIPQARPRFSQKGFVFNPQRTKINQFRAKAMRSLTDNSPTISPTLPLLTAVSVRITFKMRRPLSHFYGHNRSRAVKTEYSNANTNMHLSRTGDIDNLTKFVLDALQPTIIHDDKQVVELYCLKTYDDEQPCNGRTEVNISPFV